MARHLIESEDIAKDILREINKLAGSKVGSMRHQMERHEGQYYILTLQV